MATITLTYSVAFPPNLPKGTVRDRLAAIPINAGELDVLSMSVQSDSAAVGASTVDRTIVLETDATSDENFPTDEAKIYATQQLFTDVLAYNLPGFVFQNGPPVVAP